MTVTGMANLALKVSDLESACESVHVSASADVDYAIDWENGRSARMCRSGVCS